MHRLLKGIFVVVIGLAMAPSAAFAQATASIVGTARDASGAVLPGVMVEASSPALIERTRTVVTNGVGQYSIQDLRPGTYSVTFTLPGFTTVKRDGIELAGSFIATVNGELRVGGVQETVTVTGEAPVVDISSSRTEQTISGKTVSEIPTSRLYSSLTQLVPALNVQGNDVGGSQGNVFSVFQIHGGRRNEGQVLIDGMSAGYQGMGVSGYAPEVGNSQEIVFSLSGGLGEATTGGPQLNVIGKQGGNMFAGSFFINGSGSGLVNGNLSADQKAKGLSTPLKPIRLWDINPSFGGPIVRDKLWFFGTYRYQYNRQSVASMWDNKNAGNNARWDYDPDFSVAGIGAQQDRRLDGRPLQLPALRCRRIELRSHVHRPGGDEGSASAQREPSEHPEPGVVDITGHQQTIARGQRAARAELLVGCAAEEHVRHDDDSGFGRRVDGGHAQWTGDVHQPQLPVGQLVGAHGLHDGGAGLGVVRHGLSFVEIRCALSREQLHVPEKLLQRLAAHVSGQRRARGSGEQHPHCRRAVDVDDVRRSGIAAAATAAHLRALRTGSLVGQPVVTARWTAL